MTSRDDFSTSEWNMISRAPATACLAVLAAQPDGTINEAQAFFDAWEVASSQPFSDNQLVLTIIRERDAQGQELHFLAADSEWFSSVSAADALTAAETTCRDVASLLRAKGAAQDIDPLRQFIVYLMQRVASASKTGGVLGIGATSVTDSEKRAMDAISASLLS
jgi:hypothetical protein